jgi:hypothetical protein
MLLFGRKTRPSGRSGIDVRRSGCSPGERRRRRKRPCKVCGWCRRRGWEENIRGSGSADLLIRWCAFSATGGPEVIPWGGEPASARQAPKGPIKLQDLILTHTHRAPFVPGIRGYFGVIISIMTIKIFNILDVFC